MISNNIYFFLDNLETIGNIIKEHDNLSKSKQYSEITSPYTIIDKHYHFSRSNIDNWISKRNKGVDFAPNFLSVITLVDSIKGDFNVTFEDLMYRKMLKEELLNLKLVKSKFGKASYFIYYLTPNSNSCEELTIGCIDFSYTTYPYNALLKLSHNKALCQSKSKKNCNNNCSKYYGYLKMNDHQINIDFIGDQKNKKDEYVNICIRRPVRQHDGATPFIGGLAILSGLSRDNNPSPIVVPSFLSLFRLNPSQESYVKTALQLVSDDRLDTKYRFFKISELAQTEVYEEIKQFIRITLPIKRMRYEPNEDFSIYFRTEDSKNHLLKWIDIKRVNDASWDLLCL